LSTEPINHNARLICTIFVFWRNTLITM
jgi:hypothetical protein